jgi:hypothetical protein
MEKKVNWMVEIAQKSDLWRKSDSNPQQDRYLMSSQKPEGISKEDLDQLAEWARNQIPANRVDEQEES